jgi:hypothetical protein
MGELCVLEEAGGKETEEGRRKDGVREIVVRE